MEEKSIIEVADHNRGDEVQISAVLHHAWVATELYVILGELLLDLLELSVTVVFINNIHYFYRSSFNKIPSFDFFDDFSESTGRTFSLITYRDDSNTERASFFLDLFLHLCLLLLAAYDHNREVKSSSLDQLREIVVHLDMKTEMLKHRYMFLYSLGTWIKVSLRDGQDRLRQFFEDHDLIDNFLEVISDKEHFRVVFLLGIEVTVADDLALHT